MSNAHPQKDKLAKDRKEEFGMLDWLHNDNKRQNRKGLGYINENGLRSQIWTQSPLCHNLDLPGCTGLCQHRHPNGGVCGAPLDPKGRRARGCRVRGFLHRPWRSRAAQTFVILHG